MNTCKKFLFFLALIPLGAGCGGTLDPCVDSTCPSGQACVVVNGDAVCQIPEDSQGTGQAGDTCDTDSDCAVPLTCQEIDGLLICAD